jgi:superfamily II DNA/RNA helicase
MTTNFHSKYYAYELTKRCSSEQLAKLNQSIFNATVDLNPHQIDAALFAFRSPLSRGAILADEVGLGKTIEAGLIISQLWAENKRRILCIVPAALRSQWSSELLEKFFIESEILESKSYNQYIKEGVDNPFDQTGKIIICSYQFVRSKEDNVQSIPWDLVVIDEAHRLRNVYKKSNKIAKSILGSITLRPKILLTATPLQNSLMELYGLVSFIDPHIFGNESSFRDQFARRVTDTGQYEFEALQNRIRPICQRTLRRQVTEYIRYTNRVPVTQDFTPTEEELRLYEAVSEYLQRPESFALPTSQRSLMTLVLRKILASSSFAIAATLEALIDRLETKIQTMNSNIEQVIETALSQDFEAMDELSDEWSENQEQDDAPTETGGLTEEQEKALVLKALHREITELKDYRSLAASITYNAKGQALLLALKTGFDKAKELGAPRKALIFTESRRTQTYLKELLLANGYEGHIVTLSGTNNDEVSKAIYKDWLKRHESQDSVTGSRTADIRSALVEEFKDRASIMIATESGAEGLNLQFCSLVVNYDLPWNPQRIEQRIGRCHRYGQKHDVVVINFLNRRNAADQRVFELLSEKFRLFSGIFGASDEVLGVLGSGVDFEKRIHEIYQSCRTPDEINSAFDRLQTELEEQISIQMQDTRAKLLEHFDEDVNSRLRTSRDQTEEQVDKFGQWLWKLTKYELQDCAEFSPEGYTMELKRLPAGIEGLGIPFGQYRLITQKDGAVEHHYRIGHPLAEKLISKAKTRNLPICEVAFQYDSHDRKVSLIEALKGKTGWLKLSLLSVETLEKEEHLIFAGITDAGTELDQETCTKFFSVPGSIGQELILPPTILEKLALQIESGETKVVGDITQRSKEYFVSEMDKLERWAEDLKENLEQELKDLDKEIRATKKDARQTSDLDTKVELHKKAKEIERKRNEKRRSLFEAQDEVDSRKESLISEIEARLKQKIEMAEIFTLRWRVV